MYTYRVPLAAPYWNGTTYRRILRSFRTGRIIDGPDLSELRLRVIETLGVQEAVLCGSGGLALEVVLRACNVRQGDEVIIPTFCCAAVVSPILALGATPVLADVGEELNLTVQTVGAALTHKTKAIVVPHLFGNPADIHAIIDFVRCRNVRVIDDAAQALGATVLGRPVGSFGDAGILSFGTEKVCFGLGGGVAVSSCENFLHGDFAIDWPRPGVLPALGSFLSTLFFRRWRRWTSPLQSTLFSKDLPGPEAWPESYRHETMTNVKAAVAVTLLQTLSANIAARRVRQRAYQELLGGVGGLQLIPHHDGSACLTQVARILPSHRPRDLASDLVQALGSAGYEIQGSYVPIHLLANCKRCVWDHLPYAEQIWADLIELPCEPDVNLNDVERIAAIVKTIVNS